MKSTSRRILFYVLMLVVVLVLLVLPIWLGLGPVVHSETGLTARISN